MMYYVYAIGDSNKLDECYIGVTNSPFRRWKAHLKSGYTVSKAINENKWTYEKHMRIIFKGTEDECYDIENKYRPFPNIGLNEAIGGHGGYTSYSEERNKTISDKLKGRSITWASKISETKRKLQHGQRSNNSRALKWKLVDPSGNEHFLHGNLDEFCNQKQLSPKVLRKNLGVTIGPLSPKFRDNGDVKNRQRRINTIGWTLFIIGD